MFLQGKGSIQVRGAAQDPPVDKSNVWYWVKRYREGGVPAGQGGVCASPEKPSSPQPSQGLTKSELKEQATLWAGQQQGGTLGQLGAAVQAKFGIHIPKTSLQRARKSPGEVAACPGRVPPLPREINDALIKFCEVCHELKLPVFRGTLIDMVNGLTEGKAIQDCFPNGKVGVPWYYNWVRSNRLGWRVGRR